MSTITRLCLTFVLCFSSFVAGDWCVRHRIKTDRAFLIQMLVEMSQEPEGFVRMHQPKRVSHKEEL